ncbi:hypothetical protein K438DRAFT_1799369 [Mycena galopus ATCC 62051]|nr:hypothetical protein K438DRAFT_1799369 [Mycena galopus ATCC 62051]
MSLPDDTLRKILVQIQQTAVQSQRALNISVQQTTAKDRERRILQLTIDEIGAIEGDVNLYKGVGKMFMMSKYLEKQFNDAQAQLRDIFHHAPKQQ